MPFHSLRGVRVRFTLSRRPAERGRAAGRPSRHAGLPSSSPPSPPSRADGAAGHPPTSTPPPPLPGAALAPPPRRPPSPPHRPSPSSSPPRPPSPTRPTRSEEDSDLRRRGSWPTRPTSWGAPSWATTCGGRRAGSAPGVPGARGAPNPPRSPHARRVETAREIDRPIRPDRWRARCPAWVRRCPGRAALRCSVSKLDGSRCSLMRLPICTTHTLTESWFCCLLVIESHT